MAMAMVKEHDVIARYGAFFRGDDDLFAHCLILKSGTCILLMQGLQAVEVRRHEAAAAPFGQLEAALAQIPPTYAKASYQGYNFITDAESPLGGEIAVYGRHENDPPDSPLSFAYYAAPPGSPIAVLVKTIANID
jgi:hypothetical protein